MIGYILIVVATACGNQVCGRTWPVVTMQRFNDAKACQFASKELAKISNGVKFVCVPEDVASAM